MPVYRTPPLHPGLDKLKLLPSPNAQQKAFNNDPHSNALQNQQKANQGRRGLERLSIDRTGKENDADNTKCSPDSLLIRSCDKSLGDEDKRESTVLRPAQIVGENLGAEHSAHHDRKHEKSDVAFKRLLELLRADPSEPLPSLPTRQEVSSIPYLWDLFQEARLVKQAGQNAQRDAWETRKPQSQNLLLLAAQKEIEEQVTICDRMQRRLDDSVIREEAQAVRIRHLEAQVDEMQSVMAERDEATARTESARIQLEEAFDRMEALERMLVVAELDTTRQRHVEPAQVRPPMADASVQTPHGATADGCSQTGVAGRGDSSVQTQAVAVADACCATDGPSTSLERERLDELERQVAARRALVSHLVDIVASRQPPANSHGFAMIRVCVIRADGLANLGGGMCCEVRLCGQVESTVRTKESTIARGGVCSWEDVVELMVDDAIEGTNDLQVSLIQGAVLVGRIHVPLASVRDHAVGAGSAGEPDKWARLSLPLECVGVWDQGLPPSLLIGMNYAPAKI